MNVVVSISCLLQERYLHFDSLFSCFGIATTSFVLITKTGTKTKVRTRGWSGEEIKIKAPLHRYCHGYPESQFVAKYLNTSSIKINPHPLSAAAQPGHFRQFYARTRSRAERGESLSRAGRGRSGGLRLRRLGVAQYQLSRSLTLDKIRRDNCALSANFSPWFPLFSHPPSPTSIKWTFPGLQRIGPRLAESGGRRRRLTSLWTRGCGQGPMSRPGWRLSAPSMASLSRTLTGS